jgi:hypothetical protein
MARKITSKTDNKGWTDPSKKKVRKKRKPMTEEQKAAAAERLEKARAVRAAKNPDYGMTGIHESLRDLPDDYPITPKKVKQWIKTQKELASMERRNEKKNVKGATARKTSHEAYVRNLQKYLKDGDYVDMFYGEHQDKIISNRCFAQAYYWEGPKKGQPKFSVGTYYPLLGTVYTQEMFNEDRGISDEGRPEGKPKRRKRNKGPVETKRKKGSRSS